MLISSPSRFVVCGHHLSPRIAIVFSPPCSHATFVYFPHLQQHPVPPCIFHILPLREFYSNCFATRAHLCIFLPLSTTGKYLSFLAGPNPLHEIAVSALSRKPLGRANTFSFLVLLLTPRKYQSVPPLSPCFLALAFPLLPSFPSVVYTPNFSMNSISSWFHPVSFHTFSTTLSHRIPPRPISYG